MSNSPSQAPKQLAPKAAATKVIAAAKPEASATAAVKVQAAAKAPAPAKAKVSKPAAKTAIPAAAKASAKAKPGKEAKVNKEKKSATRKPKLVRDSFTFPEAEYAKINTLKQRALKAGHEIKKSELLRAGLAALSELSDAALLKALQGLDRLKPGRPAK